VNAAESGSSGSRSPGSKRYRMTRRISTVLVSLCAAISILATIGITIDASAGTTYRNPNAPHWHCQQYNHLFSWDCISGHGFVYGGVWAFTRDFYQHPNPSTDYVVNEPYFTPGGPQGLTNVPHWMRRLVIVEDGQYDALIAPVNWNASQNALHPAPPVTCLFLNGAQVGHTFPCSSLDQKSILDYWYQARVISNPW
jgi:hypothetical protein